MIPFVILNRFYLWSNTDNSHLKVIENILGLHLKIVIGGVPHITKENDHRRITTMECHRFSTDVQQRFLCNDRSRSTNNSFLYKIQQILNGANHIPILLQFTLLFHGYLQKLFLLLLCLWLLLVESVSLLLPLHLHITLDRHDKRRSLRSSSCHSCTPAWGRDTPSTFRR